MSTLEKLPKEVRLMIYEIGELLMTPPDGSTPTLLVALVKNDLYNEVKSEFDKTNLNIGVSWPYTNHTRLSMGNWDRVTHMRLADATCQSPPRA